MRYKQFVYVAVLTLTAELTGIFKNEVIDFMKEYGDDDCKKSGNVLPHKREDWKELMVRDEIKGYGLHKVDEERINRVKAELLSKIPSKQMKSMCIFVCMVE